MKHSQPASPWRVQSGISLVELLLTIIVVGVLATVVGVVRALRGVPLVEVRGVRRGERGRADVRPPGRDSRRGGLREACLQCALVVLQRGDVVDRPGGFGAAGFASITTSRVAERMLVSVTLFPWRVG